MVSSVTSVDFIDMLYRFSAVSPHHQELRIIQALANGGFADFYQVGRLDNHPDKSGYEPLKKLFKYHKDHEDDYHSSVSSSDIALVKPTVNFFDVLKKADIDEYFGWYCLLTQNHYFFDCINSGSLLKLPLEKYKTIILPDLQNLDDETALKLDNFVKDGGTLISTGETAFYDGQSNRRRSPVFSCLGVERLGYVGRGIISAYFKFEDKLNFPHFKDTDLVYLRGIYCYADYAESVQKYLKLIPPHNHSPAEDAYYTNVTDFPGFTVNNFGKGRGVFIPWKPGHEYYNLGFPAMGNFMADVLEHTLGLRAVGGNLPPMVEVSCTQKIDGSACYIHLVNDSGFFCGSYFEPLELHNLTAEIPWSGKAPSSVVSMVSGADMKYQLQGDILTLFFDRLNLFEAVKIV
jgi:hypothetical protein